MDDSITRRKILGILRCLHDLKNWGYIEGQGSYDLSMKGLGQADSIELIKMDEREIKNYLSLLSDNQVDQQFVKDFTILYEGYRTGKFKEQKE